MEFTLGFLGGIGMTYGVVTSSWPEKVEPSKKANWNSLIVLIFVIPAINIFQSFDNKKITQLAERLSISEAIQFVSNIQMMVWVLLIIFTILSAALPSHNSGIVPFLVSPDLIFLKDGLTR